MFKRRKMAMTAHQPLDTDSVVMDPGAMLPGDRDSYAGALTLWGSGRLNFQRASREAIHEVCRPALGLNDVARLVDLRDRQPGIDLYTAANALELTGAQRSVLLSRLTDQSLCYSIWIACDDGRRTWVEFFVAVTGNIDDGHRFLW